MIKNEQLSWLSLEEEILRILNTYSLKELKSSYIKATDSYHLQTEYEERKSEFHDEKEIFAYLLARMPAIFAVWQKIWEEFFILNDFFLFKKEYTILDLGTGPGTVVFSLFNILEKIKLEQENEEINFISYLPKKITLIEKENKFFYFFNQLKQKFLFSDYNYFVQDINKTNWKNINEHNIITMSYFFSELSDKEIEQILPIIWEKTKDFLIIVDTGTPYAYQKLMKARDYILELKGKIIAPCTHSYKCPMLIKQTEEDKWCHFFKRLSRTSLHKKIKNATLAYEDEKYTYLICSKHNSLANIYQNRLISNTEINKYQINHNVCHSSGEIIKLNCLKRNNAQKYQEMKKLSWGDKY